MPIILRRLLGRDGGSDVPPLARVLLWTVDETPRLSSLFGLRAARLVVVFERFLSQ